MKSARKQLFFLREKEKDEENRVLWEDTGEPLVFSLVQIERDSFPPKCLYKKEVSKVKKRSNTTVKVKSCFSFKKGRK